MLEIIKGFFNNSEILGGVDILINISLSTVMSIFIYLVYVKFGYSLSNRKQFGKVFFLITVCTTVIISIIKASIALSLGLVGALSIVRFRTAVKEPEELVYLFLCITMGLGFGANERLLTLVAGLFILSIITIKGLFTFKKSKEDTFNFNISSQIISQDIILEKVKPFSSKLELRRFDSNQNRTNLLLNVEFSSERKLQSCVEELKAIDPNISVSFISNRSTV